MRLLEQFLQNYVIGIQRLPWRRMQGFRNIAVHKYFAVDMAVVWKLATEEVPKLAAQAISILRTEFPDVAAKYDSTEAIQESESVPEQGAAEASEASVEPEG